MQARTLLIGLLILALWPGVAAAEIYKTVDKDGNVSYTDQAPEKGEKVELKPANTIPAVKTPSKAAAADEQEAEDKPIKYRSLRIVSPADDSAIEHGPGDFIVQLRSKPALADNHKIQLYVDGEPYGKPVAKTSFELRNVNRGTHTLQAKIINDQGKTLKTSKISSVHVFRPSVLFPGNRR